MPKEPTEEEIAIYKKEVERLREYGVPDEDIENVIWLVRPEEDD